MVFSPLISSSFKLDEDIGSAGLKYQLIESAVDIFSNLL